MITVNNEGIIKVVKEVTLTDTQMRNILKLIVSGESGEYNHSEWIHNRWSTLYNAFDMVWSTDIRAEHERFMVSNKKVSRVDFMVRTNRLGRLFAIASQIYPKEFTKHVEQMLG